MRSFEHILDEARRLPADARRRLIEQLRDEEARDEDGISEERRMAALDQWLKLAGTGHSDHTDVASDKYKHLADIYADKR